jgi:hypothetical protein
MGRLQLMRMRFVAVIVMVVMIVVRHRELLLQRPPLHRHWGAPVFLDWLHRHGHVLAGDTGHGCIEIIEGVGHDLCGDFGGYENCG